MASKVFYTNLNVNKYQPMKLNRNNQKLWEIVVGKNQNGTFLISIQYIC